LQRVLQPGAIVTLVAFQNLAFVGLGLLFWYASGRSPDTILKFTPVGLSAGLLLGSALVASAWGLFRGYPRFSNRLVELQADTYRFLGRDLRWPAIVVIAFAAGIGEEVLLRGGLQTLLGDYVGTFLAIILASAVFAAIHLARPVITALLFAIGIVFGTVYWFTGSLLAVMIAHALYDVWALRYLHSEFVRLGIFDLFEEAEPEPALVNPADPV
jgi:membrane protease YdiL (CAAX protease family)